ncbi:MAG: 16S rRNA (guanine(966)-N(2))-methyltransferase RsmD [Dehalococcoidia bacterium]|nr:16S rRNA (guanine(966)-N(2))-methyltransferase RsmD [Dehalococcoidia bacterium]
MRITGGASRGQIIKTLPGLSVRPTTDKVREAIFSILGSLAGDWERALDLFAGTGVLGIEALSREVRWVDFVDQNEKCCQVIKYNLTKTGFKDKGRVYCCPVMKALSILTGQYGMVFLDPPYADMTLGSVITIIDKSNLINEDSIILASHAARSPLSNKFGDLLKIKEKRYGDTCISIYQKEVSH